MKPAFLLRVLVPVALLLGGSGVQAEPYYIGAKACEKCHEAEVKVWEGTAHFKSYKEVHKKPEAKKILKAAGSERSMKKDAVCASCHYTQISKGPGKKAKAKAGPSCESCHGPASEWKEAHNDFGGVEKAKDEDPAHREQRIAKTKDMGMIWPSMLFDVASNCMSCHGLTKPGVEDALGKMLDAGHPIEPDFELVAYSQGSVRHRFYPPDVTVNKEMSKAELTRMFAVGQIAKLLSASEAAGNSSHPKYKAAQTERADQARAALKPVAGIGAVGAFLKAPSEKTARAAVAALEGEDLSAKLAGSLPAPSSYK